MTDPLLLEAAHGVLTDVCTHEALQAAERDGWAPAAWAAVAAVGLPWISVPEERGGQGGTVEDAAAVLRVAGAHALPLPLAETGLLAGWLLSASGQDVPQGPLTVAPGRPEDDLRCDGGRLTGRLHRVPWARAVDRVVLLVDVGGRPHVATVRPDSAVLEHRTDLAGQPRDTVRLQQAVPELLVPAGEDVDAEQLRLRGALGRVSLVAGALQRVRDTTLRYAGEREQFGKPLSRFQAVQQHLVTVAQQAALVTAAAEVAAREVSRGDGAFEVAAASVLAADGAREAARAAHQVHGAMGMTQEYSLHHVTRRLAAWSREHGHARSWSARLGQTVVDRGADDLYALVAGGSAALTS